MSPSLGCMPLKSGNPFKFTITGSCLKPILPCQDTHIHSLPLLLLLQEAVEYGTPALLNSVSSRSQHNFTKVPHTQHDRPLSSSFTLALHLCSSSLQLILPWLIPSLRISRRKPLPSPLTSLGLLMESSHPLDICKNSPGVGLWWTLKDDLNSFGGSVYTA